MTKVEVSFSEFYDKWVCQLEQCLQQLLNLKLQAPPADPQALVSTLTTHYKEYYTVKWAAAHDDVLAFFCPVWSSPLENAYSWVTDWKPSMMFQLIDSLRKSRVHGASLEDMSEDQVKKIEELRVKIRLEEEKVEREMERQQVAIADRKMVELARLATRIRNGDVVYQIEGLVEVALKRVLSGLERVVKAADCVRLKTLKCVLEVLRPWQCVDFLVATCMLQLQLRQWGKKLSSSSTQNGQNIQLPNYVN
ncbi:hypothetical protein FNV43_RR08229 [Rhamnella rubrinervis]|uniref:DOG1 domain-containing protein n=1 Tax=Rhamnella rubrinervis TaxID=2594499 RepID=A0A8K0HG44_9ROSA|nr:hypothetical protein FNV43_RR08229 [Rhamnella rubrinervis]